MARPESHWLTIVLVVILSVMIFDIDGLPLSIQKDRSGSHLFTRRAHVIRRPYIFEERPIVGTTSQEAALRGIDFTAGARTNFADKRGRGEELNNGRSGLTQIFSPREGVAISDTDSCKPFPDKLTISDTSVPVPQPCLYVPLLFCLSNALLSS